MLAAGERFRTKVARGADHDLRTGAQTASGTGVVRINGALTTVQRAAWEFANGLLRLALASCRARRTGRVCVSAICAWRAIASRRRHQNDAGRSAEAAPCASCGPGCGG